MYIGVCGDFNVAVAEVLLDGVDIYTTPAQCRATGMPQFMWGQARNLRGEGIHEFCKGSGETVWIPGFPTALGKMYAPCRGMEENTSRHSSESGNTRCEPCLGSVMESTPDVTRIDRSIRMVRALRSMSDHLSPQSSPRRRPSSSRMYAAGKSMRAQYFTVAICWSV